MASCLLCSLCFIIRLSCPRNILSGMRNTMVKLWLKDQCRLQFWLTQFEMHFYLSFSEAKLSIAERACKSHYWLRLFYFNMHSWPALSVMKMCISFRDIILRTYILLVYLVFCSISKFNLLYSNAACTLNCLREFELSWHVPKLSSIFFAFFCAELGIMKIA